MLRYPATSDVPSLSINYYNGCCTTLYTERRTLFPKIRVFELSLQGDSRRVRAKQSFAISLSVLGRLALVAHVYTLWSVFRLQRLRVHCVSSNSHPCSRNHSCSVFKYCTGLAAIPACAESKADHMWLVWAKPIIAGTGFAIDIGTGTGTGIGSLWSMHPS